MFPVTGRRKHFATARPQPKILISSHWKSYRELNIKVTNFFSHWTPEAFCHCKEFVTQWLETLLSCTLQWRTRWWWWSNSGWWSNSSKFMVTMSQYYILYSSMAIHSYLCTLCSWQDSSYIRILWNIQNILAWLSTFPFCTVLLYGTTRYCCDPFDCTDLIKLKYLHIIFWQDFT